MIRIGFTGTKRGTREKQTNALILLLMQLVMDSEAEFHHGDCIGADVMAAKIADTLGCLIVCHPPKSQKTRGWFRFNDRILEEKEYLVRDRDIVDDTEILIATPHTSYEIIRSGTWTTVRYARKQNRTIYIVKPDGTVEIETPETRSRKRV